MKHRNINLRIGGGARTGSAEHRFDALRGKGQGSLAIRVSPEPPGPFLQHIPYIPRHTDEYLRE